MPDIIIFAATDGSVIVRHPAPGADLAALAADAPTGTTATQGTHDDLPTSSPSFRSAWRMGADGKLSVDLEAARAVRRAALEAGRQALLTKVDAMALGHIVDGDMLALMTARTAKAALSSDTGTSLDSVTDLEALATHEYPSMSAARLLLAD